MEKLATMNFTPPRKLLTTNNLCEFLNFRNYSLISYKQIGGKNKAACTVRGRLFYCLSQFFVME